MTLFRPVSAVNLVFLCSVAALSLSVLSRRHDYSDFARTTAIAGWSAFTVFWAIATVDYLGSSRYLLSAISLLTAGISGYAVRLSAGRIQPHARLTTVFVVVGLVFVPYQFLDPVFTVVVQTITTQTATLLSLIGFELSIVEGPAGPSTAIIFENHPWIVYNTVSASTGFGAIALFAGLLTISDDPVKKRAIGTVVLGVLIYGLNLSRTIVVGSSIPSEVFAETKAIVTPLFGVDQPALISFYFAEYILSQAFVIAVLVVVYRQVTRVFPDVQTHVDALRRSIRTDVQRIHERRSDA